MKETYLKVQFTDYTSRCEERVDVAVVVHIISKEDQFEALNSSASALYSRLKTSFRDKKTALITHFENKHEIYLVLPDKNLEILRLAGAQLYADLQQSQIQWVFLKGGDTSLSTTEYYALLEGMILSSYTFDKYKTDKKTLRIEVSLCYDSVDSKKVDIEELHTIAEAHALCKTLVNEPVNYMDALKFAGSVKDAGKQFGFETEILHKEQIEALKMGGLLAVNKGSLTPPTFSICTYKPKNAVNKQPIVLVGKGVTFDTGGYSLKISGNMLTMKCDMAGGAAVVGIISAIAGNQLPYYVIGLVPATDNKISANALVVDDVITMMDGTTVEVQNTDAEGRLVLADALTYAKRFEPELVIDMATLTGASAAITGAFGIAVLGNEQNEIDRLKNIGNDVYERLVQLPLWEEYRALLRSSVADMSNLGGPTGGVSTAASFLEHFTAYSWIHLDIAGAAFMKDGKGYRQSGATAVPIRLIYQFIKQKCTPHETTK